MHDRVAHRHGRRCNGARPRLPAPDLPANRSSHVPLAAATLRLNTSGTTVWSSEDN